MPRRQPLRTLPARRVGVRVWVWVWVALLAVGGCASRPAPPDWQLSAKAASERAVAAYLNGETRIEAQELAHARRETARTGRADGLARIELTQCAAATASLVLQPCVGFEALRVDAGAAEIAYANYLNARPAAAQVALLPPAQRGVAALLTGRDADATRAARTDASAAAAATLRAIEAPLSRLVGAGVLFAAGRADPGIIDIAIETASAQGWRRPLLAWLGVQLRRAELSGDGDGDATQRLRRRIARVQGSSGGAVTP